MKSIKELLDLLVNKLVVTLDQFDWDHKSIKPDSGYYNHVFDFTSAILAGILEKLLVEKFQDWERGRWMDDCLISQLDIQNDVLTIGGVMISGRGNTTEQWTDPFLFTIELLKEEMSFKGFTFLFADIGFPELTYGKFRYHRTYWEEGNRDWKYIIIGNATDYEM